MKIPLLLEGSLNHVGIEMDTKRMVIFMQGLPGSGKSTVADCLAKTLKAQIVCSDDIRKSLGISHNGDGWSQEKEHLVRFVRSLQFKAMLCRGNVILDGTHTTWKSIQTYIDAIPEEIQGDISFVIELVNRPIESCKACRVPNGFPESVIDRMAEQLKEFSIEDPRVSYSVQFAIT